MKAIYHIFIITLISILSGGCNSDMVPGKETDVSATGRFTVSVLTEEVTTEDITRGTISNMDVNRFKVSIADAKGLTLVAGKEVGTLEDNDRILPVADDYLIQVTNCMEEEAISANEGWGCIRFLASETFDIVAGSITPLELECTMANAGLMVLFDEAFTNKFPVHAATTQDIRSLVFKNDNPDKEVAYYNLSQSQGTVPLRLTGGSAGKWEDRIDKTENITITKGKITKLHVSFSENGGDINVDINTDTGMEEDINGEVTVQ
jgi:hypothetical protein